MGRPGGGGGPGGGGAAACEKQTKLINKNKIVANILMFCVFI